MFELRQIINKHGDMDVTSEFRDEIINAEVKHGLDNKYVILNTKEEIDDVAK